jgi:succinate-semialdehyde dehydrogenase / glutarate-semialdehyde dehydrogenase
MARAAATLTRCILELGGHAPVLVFADADVGDAARAIAAYKFECAGQSCNAPSRIYVQAPVYERFVEELTRIACGIVVGDGRDAATTMGPLANARRLAAVERLMADAVAHGARVRAGGARLARAGWFFAPTIITDVGDGAALLSEEPFGPIAPIWPFETFDEVVARANATPYGLAAYVFTRDPGTAREAAIALEAGSVGVNELRGVPPHVGIAGVKDSGYGYEGGALGIEAFLSLKVVRGGPTPGSTG